MKKIKLEKAKTEMTLQQLTLGANVVIRKTKNNKNKKGSNKESFCPNGKIVDLLI